MALPEIVSEERWLAARKDLLEQEKELTRAIDRLNTARRQLPMVRIEKDYRFTGAEGEIGLPDLFGNHPQLIVQHMMFGPEAETCCSGCAAMADGASHPRVLAQLAGRNTAFAAISRAPYPRLRAVQKARGWTFPWYSSHDSEFNYDFHVSIDPSVRAVQFNFRDAEDLVAAGQGWLTSFVGEQMGISCFLRDGDDVFLTYSTQGRGVEVMMPAYHLLDLTTFGRQEEWERPTGRAPTVYFSDRGILNTDVVPG